MVMVAPGTSSRPDSCCLLSVFIEATVRKYGWEGDTDLSGGHGSVHVGTGRGVSSASYFFLLQICMWCVCVPARVHMHACMCTWKPESASGMVLGKFIF